MSTATQVATDHARSEHPTETRPHLQRNFRLGVFSGVAYNACAGMLSTDLVMTWFLSELTESNLLISLLRPIEVGSWYFLQLLLSGYVRRRSRSLPLYRAMGAIRVASLVALSVATCVLNRLEVLLIVFIAVFTASSVAAGVAGLPFLNVVVKTIPSTRRGMYFGWRRFVGGLLGLAGAALVKVILSPGFALGFPENYALLFFIGSLATLLAVGSFSVVLEPIGVEEPRALHPGRAWRATLGRVIRDRSYIRYLAVRVAMAVGNMALPFYAVYARRALNVSGSYLGIYLMGSTLASVLSNLIVGRLGDRYGNRLLVCLTALTAGLPPAAALALTQIGGPLAGRGALFTLVFVCQGLHATVHVIGSNNYLLELGPSTERVTYIGLAHGVIGLAVLASPLGGVVVDRLGFPALFTLSLACALVATALSIGLIEPREIQAVEQ